MMRTDIAYGGTEEAERLRMIASGEGCLHIDTLDLFTHGDPYAVTICTKCGEHIGIVDGDA